MRSVDRILCLVFILPFAFLHTAAAQPSYWYDGARKVPLNSVTEVNNFLGKSLRSSAQVRSSSGNVRSNDGTFYICYPPSWNGEAIEQLESRYQLVRVQRTVPAANVYFYQEDQDQAIDLANRIYEENQLDCVSPLWKKQIVLKSFADIPDPLFSEQWHLQNNGQCYAPDEGDISALTAWETVLGEGVSIAIVDDGVEIDHPDLVENAPGAEIDLIGNDAISATGIHGTAVAGIAAGRGGNGIGIVGVAPRAKLISLRTVPDSGGQIDEADAAAALGYAGIDVYNNSWGPQDLPSTAFEGPSALTRIVMASRIRTGRNGLGSIYVWAAGNGGNADDSNLDGYANSRYSIAVTSTTCAGRAASYAEAGSNILLNAPSGDGAIGITTTDKTGQQGYNNGSNIDDLDDLDYTNSFRGTSASAPIVSGVVALILATNPQLNWREVQQILALSADRNDPDHELWRTNGAGIWVNEQYGFGRVNAATAVTLASVWQSHVTAEQSVYIDQNVNQLIPDNDPGGLTSTVTVDSRLRVETVAVTVDIPDHGYWGDISIFLTSPQGTRVRLVKDHFVSSAALGTGYNQWTLTDVLHLGEISHGVWTLEVFDNQAGYTGTLSSWALEIYGTAIPDTEQLRPYSCDAVSMSNPEQIIPAAISRGVIQHGGSLQDHALGKATEDFTIVDQINLDLDIVERFAVARYVSLDGNQSWLSLGEYGWTNWDMQISSLAGFAYEAGISNILYSGRLAPGNYQVFNGFRLRGGEIYACAEPLEVSVED